MAETIHAAQELKADQADQSAPVKDDRPILDVLLELVRQHPEEELDKIPHDGADNHDHYLYRCPKKTWDE